MKKIKRKYSLLLLGVGLGVLYGLVSRLIFGQSATLDSIAYLFLIPTVLGIIPLFFAGEEELKSYKNIIFIPWLTLIACFITFFVLGIEDFLCLLILAIPFFIVATIGAFVYRLFRINKRRNKGKLLSLVFLPFLFGVVEESFDKPSSIYTVKSEVLINASPATVWGNIVEVDPISDQEYTSGFYNFLGVPRPLSAKVDRREVGGERVGEFEGGLRFIESITEYDELNKVAFDIKIDTNTIGEKTFHQHVLAGNYFNFVNATYQINRLSEDKLQLTLSSNYQLTSTVNFYGKFWGDLMLSDFQDRLLQVIKKRAERKEEI